MLGLKQQQGPLLSTVIEYAACWHPNAEVASRPSTPFHKYGDMVCARQIRFPCVRGRRLRVQRRRQNLSGHIHVPCHQFGVALLRDDERGRADHDRTLAGRSDRAANVEPCSVLMTIIRKSRRSGLDISLRCEMYSEMARLSGTGSGCRTGAFARARPGDLSRRRA